ncbi:hypothetical protein [Shewanella xiamenensis]|uniref:hypothetical protein n=1 Tax=Shewanella xiamenensis TaxID=332186 RepID=UPI00313B52F3
MKALWISFKSRPYLLFLVLVALSLWASFNFKWMAQYAVEFLSSENGEDIMPRIIIGVFSSLFIASYVSEHWKGRGGLVVKHAQNFFTALSLALGFYTLSRWLFLDIYGNQPTKFMPFISKLDVTVLIIALLMLLVETIKLVSDEVLKLSRSKSGVKVEPVQD